MKKLVIGCGPGWKEAKQRYAEKGIEALSIDIIPEFEPDLVFDVTEIHTDREKKNLPDWIHGPFDEIEAHHIFEHIESNKDFKKLMWDCHKSLKDGGTLDICVPYWKDDSAVECFEHIRFFNENSFMNFYNNPYHKEMKLPYFELVVNETRIHGNGSREVHVCLRKI